MSDKTFVAIVTAQPPLDCEQTQKVLAIHPDETIPMLMERVEKRYADQLIVRVLIEEVRQ